MSFSLPSFYENTPTCADAGGSASHRLKVQCECRRLVKSLFLLTVAALLLCAGASAPALHAKVKVKAHATKGNAAQVKTFVKHLKRCAGKTPVDIDANGCLTIGAAPAGGDNKFAENLRTVINSGTSVTIEVGRNVPKIFNGGFNKGAGGKSTGTQTIDLDDIEKIPFSSSQVSTLWAKLMHEIWEVYHAVKNGTTFGPAHAEGIKKENEVICDQPGPNGKRNEACRRAVQYVSRTRTKEDGTPDPAGPCLKIVARLYQGYDQPDGKKAWMCFTIEQVLKVADRSVKSGPQTTEVAVETGTGANRKRKVVTNPDPSVQYFDEDNNLELAFENYPGDPDSRPSFLDLPPDGILYIAEENKNTIEKRDAATQQWMGRIRHPQLQGPRGVSHDFWMAELYVASNNNNLILVFDSEDGSLLRSFAHPRLDGPTDVLIAGDGRFAEHGAPDEQFRVFVCNYNANNVLVFDRDGGLITQIDYPGLVHPSGIAVSSDGFVYVSSFDNDAVFVFDSDYSFSHTLTHPDLDGPQGILVNHDDGINETINVTSKNTQSVVVFQSATDVAIIADPGTVCPKGLELIESVESPGTLEIVTEGPEDCNGNGILDEFDIVDGSSPDVNDNGIPDECEPEAVGLSIVDVQPGHEVMSGDIIDITVGLQDINGAPTIANDPVVFELSWNNPDLILVNGSSEGFISALTFNGNLSVAFENASPNPITEDFLVSDLGNALDPATVTLTIQPSLVPTPIVLEYPAYIELTQNQPDFAVVPDVSGGVPPFEYSVAAGSEPLPDGLVLDAAGGTITGSPTDASGFRMVTIEAIDANGDIGNASIEFLVNPALGLAYAPSNEFLINVFNSSTATVSGGSNPIGFSVTGGSLPPGISVDPGTGEASGIPTMQGSFTATVEAMDINGAIANASLTIQVVTEASIIAGDGTTEVTDLIIREYPNPAQARSTLEYELSEQALVVLSVYDQMGRKLRTLVDQRQNAGMHKITQDVRSLTPGVYYYHLRVGDRWQNRRFVVVE